MILTHLMQNFSQKITDQNFLTLKWNDSTMLCEGAPLPLERFGSEMLASG
jgi:hypothetical protein